MLAMMLSGAALADLSFAVVTEVSHLREVRQCGGVVGGEMVLKDRALGHKGVVGFNQAFVDGAAGSDQVLEEEEHEERLFGCLP